MFWRQRSEREQDLDRELRDHMELEAQEQQSSGMVPDAARYAAQRAFGNTTLVKEDVREMWGWGSLERLGQDVQYAFRLLRKTPAITLILIATLALGLGMNTAVFSVVNAVMVRGLPYKQPDRLISLWEEVARQQPRQISTSGRALGGDPAAHRMTVAPANLIDYQKRSRVIGIFGVLSYAVSQRTAELGIRMAIGAQPKQIVALILRQAGFLVIMGILLGEVGAFAVTRYVQSLLFGVQPHDLSTYVLAAALLAAVALTAAFIPARRGARIDPMRALRYE